MIYRRVRLVAAMVAVSAFAVATAAAQQGLQTKPQSAAPVTKPVTATIQQDPATVAQQAQANARDRSAMMTCQGPLSLEIMAKDARDASKGVYYLLSFKEATAAAGMKPGECWRTGGFSYGSGAYAGSFNGGLKKGDIVYDPPVTKCPAVKSLKIEGGKVTGTFNEVVYSEAMLKAATTAGSHSFSTKWLNTNAATGMSGGWGHYIADPGDAVTPAVAGCRG